jgi:SAM-dependent methyltransferase
VNGLAEADRERFARASGILASTGDLIAERPGSTEPAWVTRRGWGAFLAGLSDETLAECERVGLAAALAASPTADPSIRLAWPSDAPADLAALAESVRVATDVAPASFGSADALSVNGRRASFRKRSQVAAFVEIVKPLLVGMNRVIDVGSGHGHLTRHLGRELPLPVEGWEIDTERVAVARQLPHADTATFRPLDVRDHVSELRRDDIVIGLHACGELADQAIKAAARTGAAVALIGCCLQKRRGNRAPSSASPLPPLGRDVLGLGNVTVGEPGVEEPLAVRLRSRENRLALALLLAEAGLRTTPGEEMRGLNRRKATGSLEELVEACFRRRGLPLPELAKQRDAGERARELHQRQRRWDLPRTMLGRVIEVWVATDRAAALAEAGHEATVRCAFEVSESPRNLIVLARTSP